MTLGSIRKINFKAAGKKRVVKVDNFCEETS
jgi:hypothetical protein